MREGFGRIQQGVLDAIGKFIQAAGGQDIELTTASICKSVYRDEVVSKAQRVSVLRVMARLPNGPLPGANGWYIVRLRNRRGWALVAPEPQPQAGETSPKMPPRPAHDGRLAATFNLLASPVPGERDAALLAAGRLLRARGLSWSDVARAVVENL